MKEFVDHIAELSPATIRDYVNTAKSVVASARDREGKMLFPRAWDDEFIDVPFIELLARESAESRAVRVPDHENQDHPEVWLVIVLRASVVAEYHHARVTHVPHSSLSRIPWS